MLHSTQKGRRTGRRCASGTLGWRYSEIAMPVKLPRPDQRDSTLFMKVTRKANWCQIEASPGVIPVSMSSLASGQITACLMRSLRCAQLRINQSCGAQWGGSMPGIHRSLNVAARGGMWVGKARHVCLPCHRRRTSFEQRRSSRPVMLITGIVSSGPKYSRGPASTARNVQEMRMQMRS